LVHSLFHQNRHCEERRDEAIHAAAADASCDDLTTTDGFAALAMTGQDWLQNFLHLASVEQKFEDRLMSGGVETVRVTT
jgi:hypothetical protein